VCFDRKALIKIQNPISSLPFGFAAIYALSLNAGDPLGCAAMRVKNTPGRLLCHDLWHIARARLRCARSAPVQPKTAARLLLIPARRPMRQMGKHYFEGYPLSQSRSPPRFAGIGMPQMRSPLEICSGDRGPARLHPSNRMRRSVPLPLPCAFRLFRQLRFSKPPKQKDC
jgi:hypothetical protein